MTRTFRMLETLLEAADEGLLLLDASAVVLCANRAVERLTGRSAETLVGRPLTGAPGTALAREVVERGIAVSGVETTPDGRQVLVSARPLGLADPDGGRVVVSLRDVSDVGALMARLQRTAERARGYQRALRAAEATATRPIVGRSAPIEAARQLALRCAATDLPVLILGETGTGKGLFAELIHRASGRREGPFLEVDCGAIPEGLMEAELFGYARGAFTGADARGKPGLVELGAGGTLVLDEIGDLPAGLQVKLLRFLEGGEIRPLGAVRGKRPDVRIVAATNRDLPEMVRRGEFRADLFYRLDVLSLRLPPLRERPEDIPLLIDATLARLSPRLGRRLSIGAAAVERLLRYRFPGNVRELANLIDRLAVTAAGDVIDVRDLPPEIADGARLTPAASPLREAVRRVEAAMLREALERFGTQELAARHLGIGQATVARKARRYGLV